MQQIDKDKDLNSIELGDFKFRFDCIKFDTPIFYADIGSYTNMLLCDYLGQGNPKDVLDFIKKDIWIDNNGYVLEISFEDSVFSFIKINLPICGFDEQYENNELKNVNILVRYTDPWTNNIATLTNLEEIKKFSNWYQDICEKIKK